MPAEPEEQGLPRLPEEPVVPEGTGVPGRTVVEPHIGKDLAGTGKGTGLGHPWLGPWGLLEDYNRLRYIRVHRHRGMIQDKSGSLKDGTKL